MNATAILRILILTITTFCLAGRVHASNYILAESPDHPKTWVVGATRIHQALRWSNEKHMLLADVTYSTRDFADGPHPTEEDDFTLFFPTVHFDPATHRFTAKGVVVATLHSGLFGPDVSLAPDVMLSIHRHHGVVYGALLRDQDQDD
jgi:hypothetical protein